MEKSLGANDLCNERLLYPTSSSPSKTIHPFKTIHSFILHTVVYNQHSTLQEQVITGTCHSPLQQMTLWLFHTFCQSKRIGIFLIVCLANCFFFEKFCINCQAVSLGSNKTHYQSAFFIGTPVRINIREGYKNEVCFKHALVYSLTRSQTLIKINCFYLIQPFYGSAPLIASSFFVVYVFYKYFLVLLQGPLHLSLHG